MGPVFEDICIQYLWMLRKQGGVSTEFSDLGRWWGNDPINKRETEIDIMGSDGKNSVLFCECKWTNENVDTGVLNSLFEKSRLFRYGNVQLIVFAKNGFTQGCKSKAKEMKNVSLVTFDEMVCQTANESFA